MTNNTRSYLNNKVWYRLLKVVYIFAISIICIIIWFFIYNDTEYKDFDEFNRKNINNVVWELGATIIENPNVTTEQLKKAFPEFTNIDNKILWNFTTKVLQNPNITPEKLIQTFPELFYKNSKEYIKEVNNLLWRFYENASKNPNISLDEVMKVFPEFKWEEQALGDYFVTKEAKPYLTEKEIIEKFPEFYNPDFIKNYAWVDNIMIQKDELINPNIKITLMLIWKFILIIWIAYLISELFKRVLYYIVLWSFNPKK